MCVAQFREFCNASSVRYREEQRQKDLQDKDVDVHVDKGTWMRADLIAYYATDRKSMRELAKNGNKYAQQYLV